MPTRWAHLFHSDIDRVKQYSKANKSSLQLFLCTQGLWALLQYRIAHAIHISPLFMFVKRPLLFICVIWQKMIEVFAGISIPYTAQIGEGLYIGHFGNVIINGETVIGNNCNISQGVTIGVSGRRMMRGVPSLGNRIYIGANAVIAGGIIVGDDVVIAANSLVTKNIPNSVTVLGVPAEIVNYDGSADYLLIPSNSGE